MSKVKVTFHDPIVVSKSVKTQFTVRDIMNHDIDKKRTENNIKKKFKKDSKEK